MNAIELFDPVWVGARLADQVPTLKKASGAADLAAARREGVKQTPVAFVIDLATAPGNNTAGSLVVSQRVASRFGVVIVAQNLRDVRGEAAKAEMRALRISVATALMGWSPAQGWDPCELGPGRLLGFEDLTLWWQDDFITRNFARSF